MRGAFVQTLVDLAKEDERVVLLTADLGFMALEPFSDLFPERFYNVGVAEQNMVGLATGLAEAGLVPYCYSIVPFAALRPFEFIRNGPVLHHLPVRVVGVGAGFEYGHAGPTHHGIDDVGALRTIPGLSIVSPADAQQTSTALRALHALEGPVYLRIGKDDRRRVPGLDGRFELGRAQVVREGSDVLLVTMGSVAAEVVVAADALADSGISTTVAIVASVAPAPVDDLSELVARHSVALSVEAHSTTGGVGSLTAEVIAESGAPCRLTRLGVTQRHGGPAGSERWLHGRYGIDASSVADRARAALAP